MRTLKTAALIAVAFAAAACSSESPSPSHECEGATSEALHRCAAGPTLQGIDVSVYQGTVSWSRVKKSGRTFAFARVSDGTTHHD